MRNDQRSRRSAPRPAAFVGDDNRGIDLSISRPAAPPAPCDGGLQTQTAWSPPPRSGAHLTGQRRMIGAAPVPVPPPRPVVTNTMSAPSGFYFCLHLPAPRRPVSGWPAPRPFVSLVPNWILPARLPAAPANPYWHNNSTPSSRRILRFTALPYSAAPITLSWRWSGIFIELILARRSFLLIAHTSHSDPFGPAAVLH